MVTEDRKFALVRVSDGWVWNTCRWNGVTPWNDLPDGIEEMMCPEYVGPGWFYIDGEWNPPPPSPEPEPPPEG